ncbi:hypothetical protein SAMN05421853_12111 [Roseivivax halotolerans]|uniref:YARHG domain-containing protein n=1 Tax=Roseivivax halotolerans TaxID=93684 RepID=A0A1I6AIH8_9RHOB|nr:hypothetical protein [Roseivivax halotolerans]SFQ68506.1 hypothetical protein SAMN05421853_12111 [Roseivivax halotolerans]
MMKHILLSMTLLAPTVAAANFVPNLDDTPRICGDRPAKPDWMIDFNVKDAHKVNLVEEMYRAQSLGAVVETGDCSCSTRFPSWAAASDYYFANYAGLGRHEILARTSDYRRTANVHRRAAEPICKAEGNW